jgi:hypothetical protein
MCIGRNKKEDEIVKALQESVCYSLERYEEGCAVLQDDEGNSVVLSKKALPKGMRIGDVLRGGQRELTLVPEETQRRQAEVADLLTRVLDKNDEEKE